MGARLAGPAPGTGADRGLVPLQAATSMGLSILLCGVFAFVGWLSRNEALLGSIDAYRLRRWKQANSVYTPRRGFLSSDARLFLDVLPRADLGQGGTYYIGASNLVGALMSWELPEELRGRVHNYAVLGASHSDQLAFLRYLAEDRGLGSSPGTRVVLALTWSNARPAEYFRSLFVNGLYEWDSEAGLSEAPMSTLARTLQLERARCFHMLMTLRWSYELTSDLRIVLQMEEHLERAHKPAAYQQAARRYMGEDWQRVMEGEMAVLLETVDYLVERSVAVTAVFMPLGTWDRELPYPGFYREHLMPALSRRDVQVLDLETLLGDEEFYDNIHPNHQGSLRTHAALIAVANAEDAAGSSGGNADAPHGPVDPD